MPITRRWVVNGALHTQAAVVNVIKSEGGPIKPDLNKIEHITAIYDTGAAKSCISVRVAEKLGLEKVGMLHFNSASHSGVESFTYKGFIGVSTNERLSQAGSEIVEQGQVIFFPMSELAAVEGLDKQGIDLLIGMDIIRMGILSVSGDTFIFSI